MKKSQVTFFIILGIITIFVIGLVTYKITAIKRSKLINQSPGVKETELIQRYIDECLQDIAIEAIKKLGEQGSIYPRAAVQTPTGSLISYYYYNGDAYFPQQASFLEEDVSRYIQENLHRCLRGFSGFDYPISARNDQLTIYTSLNKKDIGIHMKYPVSVNFGQSTTTLTDFNTKVDANLLELYELSADIFEMILRHPQWIDLDLLNNRPFDVKLIKIKDDSLAFEIVDPVGLEGKPLTYRFAVKYVR